MDCNIVANKISPYVDNEVSPEERSAMESHLRECIHCASEKRAMEEMSSLLKQVPDVTPGKNAQSVFWKKVQENRGNTSIEKIRSVIAEWDFIPVQYPATAMLLLGLVIGIVFRSAMPGASYQPKLHPAAVEYLALNRMDSIAANTITGTYLSLVSTSHEQSEYKK